jgi:hypothetical protein
MDADSGQQDQNAQKILQTVTIPGSLTQRFFTAIDNFFEI